MNKLVLVMVSLVRGGISLIKPNTLADACHN